MANVFRIAGKILRVAGQVARSIACCCAVVCVDICTGTRPTTFDITVPHFLWFSLVDTCAYNTGTNQSPYGGAFELQLLGGVLGETDDCYWYYCDDDPCNPGKKFVWTLHFTVTSYVGRIYYGVTSDTCDAADIIAALAGGVVGVDIEGYDEFDLAGPGAEIDCCAIDFDGSDGDNGLSWNTQTGASQVTLTGGPYWIAFTANC